LTKKSKPTLGRPSQFEQARSIILRALRQGAPIRTACHIAGISKSTYYEWCRLGREHPRSAHAAFVLEGSKAISTAELNLIGVIRRAAAKGDWRAALAILERRWPEEYGRRIQMVENPSKHQGPPPQLIVTERPVGYVPSQHLTESTR
jgi:transposase